MLGSCSLQLTTRKEDMIPEYIPLADMIEAGGDGEILEDAGV
jgi:hypothetical protein